MTPEGIGYKPKTEATVKQKVLVQRRLRRKYPQMFEPGWGKTKKAKPGTGDKIVPKSQRDVLRRNLTKKEVARFK